MRDAKRIQANWVLRLKAELIRDKRKTGILLALLAFAGLMAGRMLLSSVSPARAVAAQNATAPVAPDVPEVPYSSGGESSIDLLQDAPQGITRDLFHVNTHLFASSGTVPITQALVDRPDGPTEQEIQRLGVRAQAQTLNLQSTIAGASPAAIINGRVIQCGESIGGFKVTAVGPRNCVVERDSVRVRLEMKNWNVSPETEVVGEP
jgi:hypothetical protein